MKAFFWWSLAIVVLIGLIDNHVTTRRNHPGLSASAMWDLEVCRTGPTTRECLRQK